MSQISLEFESYQGQFFLTVNGHSVPLSEKDLKGIAPIVNAQGYSGHAHLRDWFKSHDPLFFKQVITECDRSGLVIDILRYLKKSSIFRDSVSQPNIRFKNRSS